MKSRWLTLVLVLGALLSGCKTQVQVLPQVPSPTPTPTLPAEMGEPDWWEDAVFYEILVRSFSDSDGDGVGDLNGLIDKLDYLNDGDPETDTDLGVTGIWLMPIFPSPSYHGYDVTDYYGVNPDYGTREDLQRLLVEAHQRGIRVIIDLVINHTSDQHPWFLAASQDPGSKYREWYIWSEDDPGYRGPDGQQVWHAAGGSYYYGLFASSMPDLNYLNPEVTAAMDEIARFWLEDVGVDGFRLDAAKHLIENGSLQEHSAATHAWFKDFRPVYKGIKLDALVIGEVYETNSRLLRSYLEDEFDLVFQFALAEKFLASARSELGLPAWAELVKTTKDFPTNQYATFLTNHDQNRVMSQLGGDVNQAKTAASLLLTSPGTPFIYYGEEIGLQGQKPDEDIRRPMQWSGEPQAGFSSGTPWRDPEPDYPVVNVYQEDGDPTSLLNHYRALIHFREDHPALSRGAFLTVTTVQAKLFACLRSLDDENLIVVINTSGEPISSYQLAVNEAPLAVGDYQLNALFGPTFETPLRVDQSGSFSLEPNLVIPPYTTWILALSPIEERN
jgi:glycosidase